MPFDGDDDEPERETITHRHPILIVLGVASLGLLLKFGTLAPCGIVRAEVRQAATREGGFGVVAGVLPDAVIDSIVAAQYGPLSPSRCIVLAFHGTPLPAPADEHPHGWQEAAHAGISGAATVTAPPHTAAARKQAGDETKAAMTECKNKRLSGELKTYGASAECSNPRIVAAFQSAGYRYMDLIYLLTAKRRELAEQVDNGTLTEAQANVEAAQLLVRIVDEDRQRDRGQK